jgi:hypothetical protein
MTPSLPAPDRYFPIENGREIRECEKERAALLSAIRSMSAASLRYKGIDGFSHDLIDWLER